MLGDEARPLLWLRYVVYSCLFTILCIAIQVAVGAYLSDHSQTSDEAAYFVTALMIAEYFAHHLLSSPLQFAQEYYQHFPRVGLGHYPPMLDIVEATLFLVFGARGAVAVASQAVIGGICAGLPAAIVSRLGIVLGLASGLAVLAIPSILFRVSTIMADNLLAVLVTLTAIAWARFYRRKTWPAALVFAVLAAAAILTKGTGFGLVLLPIIHLSLKRDFRFLFRRQTIFSAVVVGLLVVPWYVVTYRLAAGAFIYSWGWSYIRIAVPFFLKSVVGNLGIPVVVCYVLGLYFAGVSRADDKPVDVEVFVASSLAMLFIPMVIPADLAERYIVPALPSAVIVAAWGVWQSVDRFLSLPAGSPARRRLISSSLCAAIFLLSLGSVFRKPHIEPYHAGRIVAAILAADKPNPLVLVSGSADFEGAMIARFAEHDRSWSHYVVRGTAILARSNFMGTEYSERFKTPAAMADWIKQNQIGWIVVERSNATFAHNRTLQAALAANLIDARLVASVRSERNADSELQLYALSSVDTKPRASDPIFAELKPSHQL